MVMHSGCDRKPGSSAPVPGNAASPAAWYVGGPACAECHESQAKEWKGSHHDLAMQEATESTVLGDFRDATYSYHSVTSTFFRRDGKFMVRTDGADGALHDYQIAYTYGIHPLQQYLIRFPDGRIQALNICWDTRPSGQGGQRWFHLYPNEEIRHDDILHWTGPYQNWNHMCAECHSTNVRKGYNAEKDQFATTWSEINVSCETCHGPGSNHVAWARARPARPAAGYEGALGLVVGLKEDPPPILHMDTARGILTRDRPRTDHAEVETCARCHSRRGTFSESYTPGRPLAQTHRLALLEPELYEADGQIKDEVYEYGSFLQSKMYAAGVTCTDCHNPHSLKTAGGNLTCAKCHVPETFDIPSHHRHKQGSPAAECVSCHAPTKDYMVVHARHDHSFRVPRPDLTVKLGSPNACNGCHSDQTPQWAAQAAAQWWGTKRIDTPHYGESLAAARRQEPGADDRLIRILSDPLQPAIVRASAAEHLQSIPSPASGPALKSALGDPDPQVRAAAARALQTAALQPHALIEMLSPLLADPVRQVRMDAARTLAELPRELFTPAQADAFRRGLAEYRDAEQANADRAESRLNLGVVALAEGDSKAAEQEYLAAIRVSPRSAAAYVNLADLYRAQGRERDAEELMQRGLQLTPRDAGLRHALGLSLVRQRRIDEALRELGRAHEFAPQSARYAYVYAVALESTGKRGEAIEILARAHAANPGDADVLAALAEFCSQAGRGDEAIAYAERLVAARPWDPQAAAALARIRAAGAGRAR